MFFVAREFNLKIFGYIVQNQIDFCLLIYNSNTGSNIKLVRVATINVNEVNQPRDTVPPKLLAQNIIKPAIKTKDVYIMLKPVCLMVLFIVSS